MRTPLAIAAAALMLSACGTADTNSAAVDTNVTTDMAEMEPAAAEPSTARAMLASADGSARGEATATQTADGLLLRISATGVEPGVKGFHVHTAGVCEGPAFESAGGHWNPTGREHGMDNPAGAHLGDLPNLTIAADGTGTVEGTIAGATLSEGANALLDADGATIMIHAAPDDMRTDPSGDSGARIACGVFQAG